jgi:hypothetical protein
MFNFTPNNYMNQNSIKSKHERLLGTPGTYSPSQKHGSHHENNSGVSLYVRERSITPYLLNNYSVMMMVIIYHDHKHARQHPIKQKHF